MKIKKKKEKSIFIENKFVDGNVSTKKIERSFRKNFNNTSEEYVFASLETTNIDPDFLKFQQSLHQKNIKTENNKIPNKIVGDIWIDDIDDDLTI